MQVILKEKPLSPGFSESGLKKIGEVVADF